MSVADCSKSNFFANSSSKVVREGMNVLSVTCSGLVVAMLSENMIKYNLITMGFVYFVPGKAILL